VSQRARHTCGGYLRFALTEHGMLVESCDRCSHNQLVPRRRASDLVEAAESRKPTRGNGTCEVCGGPILAGRSSLYCSDRCKVVGHHRAADRRQKKREVEEERRTGPPDRRMPFREAIAPVDSPYDDIFDDDED
jgi:hypothetical protein